MILKGFKMEELKRFCGACQQEKEIVLIEKCEDGGMIELSCGHRIFYNEIVETIKVMESLNLKHKREGYKRYMAKEVQREKISGETKRRAKEVLVIDKEKNIKIHQVWEQDESGEFVLVHDEEEPLDKKKA
jgi:uncharacterized protein YheU (UPF0270 family)